MRFCIIVTALLALVVVSSGCTPGGQPDDFRIYNHAHTTEEIPKVYREAMH